jgi:hypothetical protein
VDAAIDINNSDSSDDPKINFQLTNVTTFSIGVDNADSKFKIGTTAPATGTAVTVQYTGEVGIGTTSPTATLDVDGSAIFNESGNSVDFRVEGLGESNLLFVDGSADRIGIGTASPDVNLDVKNSSTAGSIVTVAKFTANAVGTTSGGAEILVGGGDNSTRGVTIGGVCTNGADNRHDMILSTSAASAVPSERMRITHEGNVGIGRTPTTNILEVEGDASKTSAGDWLANSDARLKKEIKQMDSQMVLDKMLALKGVTYYWNDTVTGSKRPTQLQYGFTAQNIQEVFPILVEEDNLGFLQTAYGTYDAMYVESMRALQEQIDSQQVIIEAQKVENSAQEQKIESLKTETAQKLAALEAKLNALLLLNSKGAVLTAEN